MRGLLLSVAASGLLLCATGAAARDIFVNNATGNDRATGHDPKASAAAGGPVRSLRRALRLAGSGDRIVLAKTEQPYHDSVTLSGSRHGGDGEAPFTIDGNGATLDGSAPVPPKAWEHYRDNVFRFRPERVGHQQLFLDGRPAPRAASADVSGKLPKLAPKEWCLDGAHVYFAVDADKLPADYALRYARETVGITLVHVRNVAIADLTVQGFQLDGINAHNDARAVTLLRVTCRGNGRSGVAVGGASEVRIKQCLLGDNAKAQLLTLPYSKTYVSDSELLPKTAPAWLNRGGRVTIDGKPQPKKGSP